jgi:hypothetical protein
LIRMCITFISRGWRDIVNLDVQKCATTGSWMNRETSFDVTFLNICREIVILISSNVRYWQKIRGFAHFSGLAQCKWRLHISNGVAFINRDTHALFAILKLVTLYNTFNAGHQRKKWCNTIPTYAWWSKTILLTENVVCLLTTHHGSFKPGILNMTMDEIWIE